MKRMLTVLLAAGLAGAGSLGAQADTAVRTAPARGDSATRAVRLAPVVTVTRDAGRSPLELPYAISIVRPDSARPGLPHLQADELLLLVPGVTVASRTNPTQDPRIAIRGFGARSAFGVRSIRVLRDGMPLTLPDGQTPVDYLDLESVGRVEAIRGTASSLYGNASGGVIDLRSAPAPAAPAAVQVRSWSGSNDLRRVVGVLGGTVAGGQGFYQANVGHTATDNYRGYSHQRLTNGYARAGAIVAGTDVQVQALGLDMPRAENPGALTRAQLDSAPRMADPQSVLKRARKEVHQLQLGASARRAGARGEVAAQVYGGARSLYNPLTFAVVDVDRGQWGGGARATWSLGAAGRVSVGADAQRQSDLRRNWANCNGLKAATASCKVLGAEQGALQIDQREIVSSVGPYVRDEIAWGERASLSAGVRGDAVRFEVRDRFLADGDDSGARTLRAVSPMVGAVLRLTPLDALYATVSSGFETPTTTELGNQADGGAGLNRDLRPQFSTTYEAGVKGLALSRVQYDVALFDTEVRDELIQYETTNGNGRTYYRNAGRTRRGGVELEAATEIATPAGPLAIAASYAYSHFRFGDFAPGGQQYAGNRIPGIPEHLGQASLTWRTTGRSGAFVTAEAVAKSRVYANDANAASAPGYVVMNLRAGGTAAIGAQPWLAPVIGVQNLFDRRYVGSVAVNATGTATSAPKFYEPAPGRTWIVGLTAAVGR